MAVHSSYNQHHSGHISSYVPSRRPSGPSRFSVFLLAVCVVLLSVLVLKNMEAQKKVMSGQMLSSQTQPVTSAPAAQVSEPVFSAPSETIAEPKTQEPVEEPEVPEKPAYVFAPHAVESTEPSNLISYTNIMVNGTELEEGETYTSPYEEISFGLGEEYTDMQGIITFRGDNFRSGASYGETKALTEKKLGSGWYFSTKTLQDYNGNSWSGSGWTGQPLVVRWSKEMRQQMTSMYDWAREQEDLVEVIYATMDGNIYFLELETGKQTRDKMYLMLTFKGAGALDPRGYPILYVGSGVRNMNGQSHVSVINLLTCEVMYTFGDKDKFALRDWPMFDSSPLVDAETDQLIYPGENGIIYIIHLNTRYDAENGTISIDPDNVVKWRYKSERQTRYVYWLGFEDSAAIYEGYLFISDNGGHLMCLNLNTLELVWVQDILDDANCSPVLDLEDGHPYLYVSCSYHLGWRGNGKMNVPIFKIDAETGEIVWSVEYECSSESSVSGGVQGTPAIDEHKIYVPIAKTGTANGGRLVALDKETGEEKWAFETAIYSWGSPILFKDTAGSSYLIYNNGYSSNGNIFLINPDNGDVFHQINVSGNIEASGAVFENWLVIGHRSCRILGYPLL